MQICVSPLKSPRYFALTPPDMCLSTFPITLTAPAISAPVSPPLTNWSPQRTPRAPNPESVRALPGDQRPFPKHPWRAFPLFIHSTNICSINFRCPQSPEHRFGPRFAGALLASLKVGETNLGHYLASTACDLPSVVPPSPKHPGALRHLPALHSSPPAKKALMVHGDHSHAPFLPPSQP